MRKRELYVFFLGHRWRENGFHGRSIDRIGEARRSESSRARKIQLRRITHLLTQREFHLPRRAERPGSTRVVRLGLNANREHGDRGCSRYPYRVALMGISCRDGFGGFERAETPRSWSTPCYDFRDDRFRVPLLPNGIERDESRRGELIRSGRKGSDRWTCWSVQSASTRPVPIRFNLIRLAAREQETGTRVVWEASVTDR